MADYPEFTDEFTEDLRQMVVGDRVHNSSDPLPSFDPRCPVGTVADWDKDRVIVRTGEFTWQFKSKV